MDGVSYKKNADYCPMKIDQSSENESRMDWSNLLDPCWVIEL